MHLFAGEGCHGDLPSVHAYTESAEPLSGEVARMNGERRVDCLLLFWKFSSIVASVTVFSSYPPSLVPLFTPENGLRRVHLISLVDIKEFRPPHTSTDVWLCTLSVMLLILAVVLPTPHDYSGTFLGGSARFIASTRTLRGARRVLYPSKQPREITV